MTNRLLRYFLKMANGRPVVGSLVARTQMPATNGTWVELTPAAIGICCGFQPPALTSPANFATAAGGTPTTQIALSWTAVTGADSYLVEKSTSSTFASAVTTVYSSTGTSTTATGLTSGTLYYFRITAVSTGRDYQNSAYAFASRTTS